MLLCLFITFAVTYYSHQTSSDSLNEAGALTTSHIPLQKEGEKSILERPGGKAALERSEGFAVQKMHPKNISSAFHFLSIAR